jgi:hypothetical protein
MAYEIFFDNYSDKAAAATIDIAKTNGWEKEAKAFRYDVYDALEQGVRDGQGSSGWYPEDEKQFDVPPKGKKLVDMTENELCGYAKRWMDGYF